MEWETQSTPELASLANQLTHTQQGHLKERTKILNFQLWQMKAPKRNQKPSSFCDYCKEPSHWKKRSLQI